MKFMIFCADAKLCQGYLEEELKQLTQDQVA